MDMKKVFILMAVMVVCAFVNPLGAEASGVEVEAAPIDVLNGVSVDGGAEPVVVARSPRRPPPPPPRGAPPPPPGGSTYEAPPKKGGGPVMLAPGEEPPPPRPTKWVVNFSTQSSPGGAERVKDKLLKAGYKVYVINAMSYGKPVYKVRVGFFDTAAEARAAATRLSNRFQGRRVLAVKITMEEFNEFNFWNATVKGGAPAGGGTTAGSATVAAPEKTVKAKTTRPAKAFPSDVDTDIPETGLTNPNAIAVVIGNRDYTNKDIPPVDYALNDAASVKEYLIKVLGYREGNILYFENATKANFEATFGNERSHKAKLYNFLKKGKSDIFVYYSGHGAPDLETKDGYFVPIDADPQAISFTGYPLKLLYDNLAKVAKERAAPNVVIAIDACFSGASEAGMLLKNASPITIEVANPLLRIPNAVVLTSSSGSEISSWYPEKGHSMFTYFFLKALKEKADDEEATAEEVFGFITDETDGLPYYARRLHGRVQTPQLMGDGKRFLMK